MGQLVGVDALILYSLDNVNWVEFPQRNEFSINIAVDVAEYKPFVKSLADAWVGKQRTWMNWSGSMNGYYDDTDDTVYTRVVNGAELFVRFYDSRYGNLTLVDVLANVTKYWAGKAVMTNVDHSTNTDDFSTLSADFEGSGKLDRHS
jgi:hypothetical protein